MQGIYSYHVHLRRWISVLLHLRSSSIMWFYITQWADRVMQTKRLLYCVTLFVLGFIESSLLFPCNPYYSGSLIAKQDHTSNNILFHAVMSGSIYDISRSIRNLYREACKVFVIQADGFKPRSKNITHCFNSEHKLKLILRHISPSRMSMVTTMDTFHNIIMSP